MIVPFPFESHCTFQAYCVAYKVALSSHEPPAAPSKPGRSYELQTPDAMGFHDFLGFTTVPLATYGLMVGINEMVMLDTNETIRLGYFEDGRDQYCRTCTKSQVIILLGSATEV